jgi:D-glycero-alpha-D-manno-heptose-7-phosphate kinase
MKLGPIKRVTQHAACRIDLAGGTVDLWPLYLYLGNLELVNMGIAVRATAEISWRPAQGRSAHSIAVASADMKCESRYSSLSELAESLRLTSQENPLRWVNRVLCHHLTRNKSAGEWQIKTRSEAPPGSGLGGSSVLGVALSLGLERLLSGKAVNAAEKWRLQQEVRDLEAVEIEHPAGDQDYVPALFGGLLIFKLGPQSRSVEKLSPKLAKNIGDRTALLYTGKPHHSGLNNWAIFKAFHEGDVQVRSSLKRIRDISAAMAESLRREQLKDLGELINEEWMERQRLSPAICPPVLNQAWEHGRALGAVARKACGAGGGGCLLLYFADKKSKDHALKTPLPDTAWRWLDTSPA